MSLIARLSVSFALVCEFECEIARRLWIALVHRQDVVLVGLSRALIVVECSSPANMKNRWDIQRQSMRHHTTLQQHGEIHTQSLHHTSTTPIILDPRVPCRHKNQHWMIVSSLCLPLAEEERERSRNGRSSGTTNTGAAGECAISAWFMAPE